MKDYLFHSVRAALAFAYTIGEFPIASSPKLTPSTGSGGRLASLSPQEKHTQGAMIRQAAEKRMSPMDTAVTFAFYGSGKVRKAAILVVSREVSGLVKRSGLGIELAKRAFSRNGVRASQQQLASEFGLSQSTVQRLDKAVADEIDRMRSDAEARLEDIFVSTGIAESL